MTETAADNAVTSGEPLVVRVVLRTDVGLVRSENQDFAAFTTPAEERDSHTGGRLFIVADGMGGHRGGATASRLAAETVKAQYLGSETTDVASALRDALSRANARIFSEAQANPDLRGMGTTTSALAVRNGEGWFAHVGDSRIYRVRKDEIKQLTEDHSLVASMVREGLITPKEAETHPRRNVLQRSMGVAEDVEIDVQGPFELQEGDTFILCSDGLHGLVKEPELKEVAKFPIEKAADDYVKLALARGAPDNVTVIVARVERGGAEEPIGVGDETLSDTALDKTQELDSGAFDETVKDPSQVDTDKIPIVVDEPVTPAVSETAAREEVPDTLEIPAPPIPPPAAALPPGMTWGKKVLLVLVVLVAAAGAFLYWMR